MSSPLLLATELPPAIDERLKANGIAQLNPLQESALDAAMQGLDLVVHAQTGSGKTLCYGLPLLLRTLRAKDGAGSSPPLRGLVLVPTLELAAQVARVLNALQAGSAAAVPRDATELPRGAPIVIGPPATLMRLLSGSKKKGIVPKLPKDLIEDLACIVVDEADALLMPLGKYATQKQKEKRASHPKAGATLLQLLCSQQQGKERVQVLAASATIGRPLRRELSAVCDRKFEVVREPEGSAASASADAKQLELKLLNQCELDAVALDEAILTQEAITPEAAAEQAAAEQAAVVDGVTDEQHQRLLVATPSGARGLDLHGLGLVVIAGVPKTADAFVHLAGRTARQGASGRVVVLTTEEEADARLPTLGSQLGVDFREERRHVSERVDKWAEMWKVHEKIVRAEAKGY